MRRAVRSGHALADGLTASQPLQPGIIGPRTSMAGIGWHVHWLRQQKGVMRYNCADSLDRTNVGSFFGAVQVRPHGAGPQGQAIGEAAQAGLAPEGRGLRGRMHTMSVCAEGG